MNFTKFKKNYYTQKYSDFIRSLDRLSLKQKGEFLLEATREKDFDLVCFLGEHGAPINFADKNGTTGLMIVAQNVYEKPELFQKDRNLDYKLARFFLDKMTSNEINAQDTKSFHFGQEIPPYALPLLNKFTSNPHRKGGLTALMYLSAHPTNQIYLELDIPRYINGVFQHTELIEDTRVLDLIYLFRAYGAQTNIRDPEGFDCLKYAITYGNVPAANTLLSYVKPFKNSVSQPSNVDAQDIFGNTAYMYASSKQHVDGLLELLEDHDANPNLTNINHQNALNVASPAWATEHVEEYTKKYNSERTYSNDDFSNIFSLDKLQKNKNSDFEKTNDINLEK